MFEEKQRFKQGWIWLVMLPVLGLFVFGVIQYFVFKQPFGDRPMLDLALLGISTLLLGTAFFFIKLELYTKVDASGIHYKFFPFHKQIRVIEWKEIRYAHVRKYRPLKDYGGWGIRYSTKGKAYNVSGRYGLQLELKNEKKILFGTQRPEKLESVLKQLNAPHKLTP